MRPGRPLFTAPPASALALALALFSTSGCARRSAPPPPDAGPHVRSEPMDPSSAMETAQLDLAKVNLDLAQCRGAIRAYQQLNDGKSPASIAELGVRLSFPNDLVYDPRAGTVKSKTYPQF